MRKPIPLIVIGEINPMLHDIGQDLAHKVRMATADAVDTCDRVELDRLQVVKMVMGVNLTELLRATYALDMTEKEFTGMCRAAYHGWTQQAKEDRDG